MKQKLTVDKKDTLLNYLFQQDLPYSKSKIKSLLKFECIHVNDKPVSQFDAIVKPGNVIKIYEYNHRVDTPLKILYEDENILVIDKPYGLLAISTQKNEPVTAYRLASEYVKSQNPRNRIFIVHRLDRDTSGVMMFAKNQNVQTLYQKDWNKLVKERLYLAVVEGVVEKDKDTIQSFLMENKTTHMYSTNQGQKAITHYRVLDRTEKNTLVALDLETGRKNQIRVHMYDIGHPIVGDRKYNAKTGPIKRMGLHAYRLTITNPFNKETQTFVAKLPKSFYTLTNVKAYDLDSII